MSIIGLYPFINETVNGKDISLDTFLQHVKDGHWQDVIIPLRIIKDKNKLAAEKKKLPYVTISGTFKQRNNNSLKKHSGFICIDIDNLNENVEFIKSQLCCDNYFYAVFTSCSGNGLCALAKINPKAHLESFNFLSEYLYTKYDINVDESGKDVCRARFVSYDPDLYINENSQLTPFVPEVKKEKKLNTNFVFQQDDFEQIIKQIANSKIDITATYNERIAVGFALASKYGEGGRPYFHAISQFNDTYEYEKADRKFTSLLKSNNDKTTIGTIYYLAKQKGLVIYSEKTQNIIRTAKSVKKMQILDNKQDTVKQYLTEFEGLTHEQAKEAEPLINQVLSEPVAGNEENLVLDIKGFIRQNYSLRRNVISRNIELKGVPIDDIDINSIFVNCKTVLPKATKDLVRSILFSDFTVSYNPFIEFFAYCQKNKPEIQTGHIDQLIRSIKTDTNNYDLFIRKWLVSLIASLKGYHSPLMLVFCGGQNTGKTHWFRHLLPESLLKYYAESKLDAGKDDEILMTKKLIIMDDEMGGKSKTEQKKLKEMTSKQTFSIREPYGTVSVDLTRLAMLCGTTNDEEILNDPTGNRRILPVRVLDIDRKLYNSINKDLVFFEAFLEYERGYDYNLSNDEIKILNDSTEEFKQSNMEEELVLKYYRLPELLEMGAIRDVTNSEIVSNILIRSQMKLSSTKLGIVLKTLGFEKKKVKVSGVTKGYYTVVEL